MSKILSIDLGTGNSCMSIWENGQNKVIPNAEGDRTTPSIVAYTDNGILVGKSAKNQMITNPKNTVYEIKRLIGKQWSDEKAQADIKRVPYECVKGDDNSIKVKIKDKLYSPEEISAQVLMKLKKDAEAYTGEKIEKAIITCPAYFNDQERQATKNAGKIAGLDVIRIINEPTAASLAYGFDKNVNGNVLIYDNGSGTLDVSILEIVDGVFEVKATSGDVHCGGSDIDNIIINYINDEFKASNNIDLKADNLALQRLKDAAEKAKIELSSALTTTINIPFITADATGPKHLNIELTRAKFESLIDEFVMKTLKPIDNALKDADLSKSDIKEIIMVGGTTRIPMIQEKVKEYFGKELNKTVNPDEVVSAGAAVQASVLQGENTDILLLDVTPLSLGIETLGGIFTRLVDRNTTIPVKKSMVFSTAEDNQPAVTIKVFQGERDIAVNNKLLGEFTLTGIVPAPRGIPQIEVTFDIDANGIVNVSAKDKGTGKEQSITIKSDGGLSDAEIEQMKKDAEANAEEDKKKKELIESKNGLESLVHQTEKTLNDSKDKFDEETIKNTENAIKSANEVLAKTDATLDDYKTENDKMMQIAMKLGEVIYKSSQQNAQSENNTPNEEKVTDVEAEEVK